jgi:hypothetical protein
MLVNVQTTFAKTPILSRVVTKKEKEKIQDAALNQHTLHSLNYDALALIHRRSAAYLS